MWRSLFILAFLQLSCSKEYRYDFIQRPLQGEINGQEWEYTEARWRREGDSVRFRFYAEVVPHDTACAEMDTLLGAASGGNRAEVVLPLADLQRLHYLHFNFQSFVGIVVDLYDAQDTMNTIVQEGAIEITDINYNTGRIQGQMDIRYNKDNLLNGQFEAIGCP